MSVNGDVTVIRNGRSTSTVSIYNYPEHLNPFYEDDQHKRIRFWPINKKFDDARRNSFSLGGIKDMWAFKSFRTKKKSSTLGINKTSESPPELRRVYPIDSGNLFNSYDRRARYSSNDGADNFQRNALYRSSLQNVQPKQQNAGGGGGGGFGLNRNDQYRCTIQFGNRTQSANLQTLPVPQARRYVYGGSVTPQPSRSSEFGRVLTHGSSQASISTNPFDSDYEEESEHVARAGDTTSLSEKRTPRKKRRAPAPPTPSTNGTFPSGKLSPESSHANQAQTELRIEEDMKTIANLTAEIESFVKDKNAESPEREAKVTEPTTAAATPNKELPKTNGTIPKAKLILKRTSPNMIITKEFKPQPIKNSELQINEADLKIEEKPALPEKKKKQQQQQQQEQRQAPAAVEEVDKPIGNVECIHVHVESPRSTPEPDASNRVTSFKKEPTAKEKISAKTSFTLTSPPTSRRQSSENVKVMQKVQVTETVTTITKEHQVNGIANGQIKDQTTYGAINKKPPIAAKPANESNGSKASNFAVIHKPGKHVVVLSSESENLNGLNPETVKADEITITEVDTPKSRPFDTTTTTKIVIVENNNTDLRKSKIERHIPPSQKHVVFQTEEVKEKVMPVPESRPSLEKKPEITPRLKKEKLIVETVPEHAASSSKANAENGAQSLPMLEIVESHQEQPLRINEPSSSPSNSVTSATSSSNVTAKPRTALLSESREEFEALYRHRPTSSHAEWKQSTLAPLETHIPPEKRRSVREIIESINRSQRLLHAAAQKDLPELITTRGQPPPSYHEVVNNESTSRSERQMNSIDNDLSQTLREFDETQREIESMFPSTSSAMNGSISHNSNPSDADTQKPNNEDIFKKDRVNKEVYDYRETSPTASNLDWNPVPKPKRSKNFGDQHE